MSSDSLRRMCLQEKCKYEGPASLVFSFFHTLCCLPVASLTVLDHLIGIRLEALEKCYVLALWVYPQGLVENDSDELPLAILVGL